MLELVGGLLEQRLERRVLERLGGLGVVEHLLKSRIHALGLADLGNRVIREHIPIPGRGCLNRLQDALEIAGVRGQELIDIGAVRCVDARPC